MKKRTVELLISIGEYAMELLLALRDKTRGRRKNDNKGTAEKK